MDSSNIKIIAECPIDASPSQHFEIQDIQQSEQSPAEISVEIEVDSKENHMKSSETSTLEDMTLEEPKASESKSASNEFFHFVRLMQLFPTVHPATLHSVMTMCKSDFFLAVDRLLYAKRCKEMFDGQKRVYSYNSRKRCSPYPCMDNCEQGGHTARPSKIVETNTRRMKKSREKNLSETIMKCTGQMQILQTSECEESPITLQCNIPLAPLSPTSDGLQVNGNARQVGDVVTSQM